MRYNCSAAKQLRLWKGTRLRMTAIHEPQQQRAAGRPRGRGIATMTAATVLLHCSSPVRVVPRPSSSVTLHSATPPTAATTSASPRSSQRRLVLCSVSGGNFADARPSNTCCCWLLSCDERCCSCDLWLPQARLDRSWREAAEAPGCGVVEAVRSMAATLEHVGEVLVVGQTPLVTGSSVHTEGKRRHRAQRQRLSLRERERERERERDTERGRSGGV